MCKMTSHTMIRVEMTLQEAQDIIVNPDPFVVQLQDMLPAMPLDSNPQAKGAREAKNRKSREGYTLPKRHYDECNRDISISRWDRHQAKHAKSAAR